MIQALEAYGAEGGQSEEELCEASVFIRMLLSTVFVEARINFRSKQINLRPTLEDANIWWWKWKWRELEILIDHRTRLAQEEIKLESNFPVATTNLDWRRWSPWDTPAPFDRCRVALSSDSARTWRDRIFAQRPPGPPCCGRVCSWVRGTSAAVGLIVARTSRQDSVDRFRCTVEGSSSQKNSKIIDVAPLTGALRYATVRISSSFQPCFSKYIWSFTESLRKCGSRRAKSMAWYTCLLTIAHIDETAPCGWRRNLINLNWASWGSFRMKLKCVKLEMFVYFKQEASTASTLGGKWK